MIRILSHVVVMIGGVAWANSFARALPIAYTGKLSLAHGTHQVTCVNALGETARNAARG